MLESKSITRAMAGANEELHAYLNKTTEEQGCPGVIAQNYIANAGAVEKLEANAFIHGSNAMTLLVQAVVGKAIVGAYEVRKAGADTDPIGHAYTEGILDACRGIATMMMRETPEVLDAALQSALTDDRFSEIVKGF